MNYPGWRGQPRDLDGKQGALAGKPWLGLAEARSGPWGHLENFAAKLRHPFTERAGSEIFQRVSIQQNWGGGGGWGACGFFKIGTAKGTSVTIANSNSKARDTGVSQSTVIRWWWLFFVWLNNIFSLNPTWPPLAESHKNNKGKRKPAWNKYPAWKILGSTLNLVNL